MGASRKLAALVIQTLIAFGHAACIDGSHACAEQGDVTSLGMSAALWQKRLVQFKQTVKPGVNRSMIQDNEGEHDEYDEVKDAAHGFNDGVNLDGSDSSDDSYDDDTGNIYTTNVTKELSTLQKHAQAVQRKLANPATFAGKALSHTDNQTYLADLPQYQNMRQWFLCQGHGFRAPSKHEVAAGTQVGNQMMCTKALIFEDLCCVDFTTLPFTSSTTINLASTQLPDSAALLMDVRSNDARDGEKGIICTESQKQIDHGGSSTVSAKMECIKKRFDPEELTNPTVILNTRVLWLMEQGLPASSIPTCKKTIKKCPNGTDLAGKPPNSASDETLQKLEEQLQKSLLQVDGEGEKQANNEAVMAFQKLVKDAHLEDLMAEEADEEDVYAADMAKNARLRRMRMSMRRNLNNGFQASFGLSGALMTSGSFTMMSSSNSD